MKRLQYIILSLLLATTTAAQLPHNYQCDFENEAENAMWNLNHPKNELYLWLNQWAIGEATASLGHRSMYISPDGGATAGYQKDQSRVMIAWRELQLEAGRYDLAFDWVCRGDSSRASLLVAWVPESDFGDMYCKLSDDYKATKWIANNMLRFDGSELRSDRAVWTHAVDTIRSDGEKHRLVFLFVYSSAARIAHPGPGVDNIQLCRNNCGMPTDMKISLSGRTAQMAWQSQAEKFNLRMHRMGDTKTELIKDIPQTNYNAIGLQDGVYDNQIQIICEGDTSVWYNFPTAFVYDARCFDYLDLKDERCTYSSETESDYTKNDKVLDTLPHRKIDYGYTSAASRHTIHYDPNEYDMMTAGSYDTEGNEVAPLKTVPEGALASVRVGSWEKTARVARIEYDFTVDAEEASVLLLQYAMVLQYAKHGEKDRPRLMIDIVDAETGVPLSTCTTVDLAAQISGEGWYRVPANGWGKEESDQDVCWRDWTTLGLNLAYFDGRHVKVKVTAIGCSASIHYGYAYFTLTCTSGKLQGIQCGWTPTNEFIAPDGFNYRWFLASQPNVTLGRDKIYNVDYRDTRDYIVELTYKSNAGCGFTLNANAIPRFPIAEASYELKQHDCGNYITLVNTSHIRTRDWVTGDTVDTDVRPDYVKWDFGNLTPVYDPAEAPWKITFRLPDEEAQYQFKLTAGVGQCDTTVTIDVQVPAVRPDSVVEHKQACLGTPYPYHGVYYTNDTLIKERGYNRIGCDSVHVVDLRFVEAIYDTITASITDGESYLFDGKELTMPGEYDSKALVSTAGCDSFVHLSLEVYVPLQMEITQVEHPCAGASSYLIQTHARKGIPNAYTLTYSAEAQQAGFVQQSGTLDGGVDNTITVDLPTDAAPGYYPFTLLFDSENNGSYEYPGELAIYYPSSLIQQRWDDVLGILNAEHNGGYDFTAFRWYRNGVVLEGATEPYLYVEDKLKPGDIYTVELGLEGELRPLMTCGYTVPAQGQVQTGAPTSQKIIRGGQLYVLVNGNLYNTLGERVE